MKNITREQAHERGLFTREKNKIESKLMMD